MTRASAAGRSTSGAVTPKHVPGQPVHVVTATGERHHRVQRQRQPAPAHGGLEHGQAVAAAGVRQHAALHRGFGGGQPGHQAGQHVVGHGKQGQVGAAEHLAGVGDDRGGKGRAGPADGGLGHRGGGHHRVPGPGQGRAEGSAGPPGADDADGQPGRVRPGGAGRGRVGPGGAGRGRAGLGTGGKVRAGLAAGQVRVHLSFQSSRVPDGAAVTRIDEGHRSPDGSPAPFGSTRRCAPLADEIRAG